MRSTGLVTTVRAYYVCTDLSLNFNIQPSLSFFKPRRKSLRHCLLIESFPQACFNDATPRVKHNGGLNYGAGHHHK